MGNRFSCAFSLLEECNHMALTSTNRGHAAAHSTGKQRVIRRRLEKINREIRKAKTPAEKSWLLTQKYSLLKQLAAGEISAADMESPEDLRLHGMPYGVEIRRR